MIFLRSRRFQYGMHIVDVTQTMHIVIIVDVTEANGRCVREDAGAGYISSYADGISFGGSCGKAMHQNSCEMVKRTESRSPARMHACVDADMYFLFFFQTVQT